MDRKDSAGYGPAMEKARKTLEDVAGHLEVAGIEYMLYTPGRQVPKAAGGGIARVPLSLVVPGLPGITQLKGSFGLYWSGDYEALQDGSVAGYGWPLMRHAGGFGPVFKDVDGVIACLEEYRSAPRMDKAAAKDSLMRAASAAEDCGFDVTLEFRRVGEGRMELHGWLKEDSESFSVSWLPYGEDGTGVLTCDGKPVGGPGFAVTAGELFEALEQYEARNRQEG